MHLSRCTAYDWKCEQNIFFWIHDCLCSYRKRILLPIAPLINTLLFQHEGCLSHASVNSFLGSSNNDPHPHVISLGVSSHPEVKCGVCKTMTGPSFSQPRAHFLWHHFLLLMKTKNEGETALLEHVDPHSFKPLKSWLRPSGVEASHLLKERMETIPGARLHMHFHFCKACVCKRQLSVGRFIKLNGGDLKSHLMCLSA